MPEDWRSGKNIDYQHLPPSRIEDQIIKMRWVLGFERMVPVFKEFHQEWNDKPGLDQLKTRLEAAGWQSGRTLWLGKGLKTAKELDLNCQVNSRTFGESSDVLDDLYGAIFRASLKLAVIGKTSRSLLSKRDLFEIEKIGIYVRDTYDFNAGWFEDTAFGLGIWNKNRLLSKREMLIYKAVPLPLLSRNFPGFVPARNEDFRRWQNQRNEGGDFFLSSRTSCGWLRTLSMFIFRNFRWTVAIGLLLLGWYLLFEWNSFDYPSYRKGPCYSPNHVFYVTRHQTLWQAMTTRPPSDLGTARLYDRSGKIYEKETFINEEFGPQWLSGLENDPTNSPKVFYQGLAVPGWTFNLPAYPGKSDPNISCY